MKETITSYINLSDKVYTLFFNSGEKKEAPKHQILFAPPKVSRKCLFIESGLLRGYKLIEGKDYTHHFYAPKWFATDFKSFLTNTPSTLFIETLTKVHYYEFDKEHLYKLYASYHELERLGRIIAEKAYLFTVEKLADLQTLDLTERYQSLIIKNAELFQQVPQKYIASYLGVSEQSLSRIKKKCIS
ncbi:Crp/Fnr family transcriptional regulator [Ascidiimonas sp. W6]|uniref:Crp/Fnr family transcriptional regulator n=1 Tax=Ascidiimonas meishanensis TaxID=3128903 RepID=UPI0030EBEC3A